MKILGLDVGAKRIGVARADSATRIAVPAGYIEVDGTEWQEIARLAKQYNTNLFVLGLPRNNEGKETMQTEYVRNFARSLVRMIPGAKIKFQDESLTSVLAEERLKKRKKTYTKGEIDEEAAVIILQDFLESIQRQSETNIYEQSQTNNYSQDKINIFKESTPDLSTATGPSKDINQKSEKKMKKIEPLKLLLA